MRNLIPGERFVDKPDVIISERMKSLSPYVRQSGDNWRGPWLLKERKLLDYLLVYIAGGEGVFSVDGEEFPITQKDLIWIPPDTLHEMRGTSSLMNCVYIHFDLIYDPDRSHWDACIPGETRDLSEFSELMHPVINDPVIASWKGKIPLSNHQNIMRLMKQICLEFRRFSVYSQLSIQGMMLQLINELIVQSFPEHDRHPYWDIMQDAAANILDSAASEISIKEIAGNFQLSDSHFRRLFKEVHHHSPRKMHQKAKISLACEKLVYTNMTIAEIADELNYNNVHNFSRAFKEMASVSPGRYRKSRGEA